MESIRRRLCGPNRGGLRAPAHLIERFTHSGQPLEELVFRIAESQPEVMLHAEVITRHYENRFLHT